MHVFDASSMVHAWDNYPIKQFPVLWEWLGEQIEAEKLTMPEVAFDEVKHKIPECGEWLKFAKLKQLAVTAETSNMSMRIKSLIGIINDQYHPKGVDENDIVIIATAKVHGGILVSDEGRQVRLPDELTKVKIPAVCNMREVNVQHINFIEYLRVSEHVFR